MQRNKSTTNGGGEGICISQKLHLTASSKFWKLAVIKVLFLLMWKEVQSELVQNCMEEPQCQAPSIFMFYHLQQVASISKFASWSKMVIREAPVITVISRHRARKIGRTKGSTYRSTTVPFSRSFPGSPIQQPLPNTTANFQLQGRLSTLPLDLIEKKIKPYYWVKIQLSPSVETVAEEKNQTAAQVAMYKYKK